MKTTNETVRIAAIADIHYNRSSQGSLQSLFTEISNHADILLLCGDCTDTGLPEEAHILTKDLTASVKIPIVGVLGNHDYESGRQQDVWQVLCDAGIKMLDGDSCEVRGIGFVGIKGFAGGFDQQAVQAWGEDAIKHFVQEAVNEALRLESALSKLKNPQRIALLHYSPIRATVEGENPELFPFLGSSRLEEPLNRFQVTAIFHGHAHSGSPEGRTKADIPVYNVSRRVLKRAFPDRLPFRLIQLAAQPKEE